MSYWRKGATLDLEFEVPTRDTTPEYSPMGHVGKTLILRRINVFEKFEITAETAGMTLKEFEKVTRKLDTLLGGT